MVIFFCYKQKTAYEMRISDWSSDVCSSDLNQVRAVLERIDAIEALGITPVGVSPAYWRTLANRLAARLPLPEYTADRHAAWLIGRALPLPPFRLPAPRRVLAHACTHASSWRARPPEASLRLHGLPSSLRLPP